MFILDHLLHICQVRRCVRKMRKIQVDVSSLFLCIRCRVEVRGGAPRSFASYLGTCDKLCWICSGSGMGAPASSSATPSSSSPSLTPAPTTPANSPLARLPSLAPWTPSARSDFSQPGPASPQSSFAWSLTSGRLSCCIFLPFFEKCLRRRQPRSCLRRRRFLRHIHWWEFYMFVWCSSRKRKVVS